MLDHPEKTARLIAALKVAVPFEIALHQRWLNSFKPKILLTPFRRTAPSRICLMLVMKAVSCATSFRWTKNKHSLSPSLMFACRVRCRLHRLSPSTRNIE